MQKPVKTALIVISSVVLIFAVTAVIFKMNQADIDEAAIKKEADEKADELLDKLDNTFEESDSLNITDSLN